ALKELKTSLLETICPEGKADQNYGTVAEIFRKVQKNFVRTQILKSGNRIDGRGTKNVRQINCQVGLLPRTHGSALFTRGETQALAVVTFGTKEDQQIIDALGEEYRKSFMLHYNFPPFSVGEAKRLSSPGRREVGHGALAERSLKKVLPQPEDFPYTIRLVSEILESNGSSSMATVCGGSLAMMDAGVPIKAAGAGIAMGLIKEGDEYAILSDILGDEDHLGDMDFKVAGTEKGITALQMDIKIAGLSEKLLKEALAQAKEGRLHILGEMRKCLTEHRTELSPLAPKIILTQIDKSKIGALIGPGGSNIRAIIDETGAKIDVDDDGNVHIYAADQAAGEAALRRVKGLTAVPEAGKYYKGKVVKIMEFGAFVNIMPNVDGLVHVSQLDKNRVNKVTDAVKEGDEFIVKCLEIDKAGKIRLSRKDAMDYTGEVVEL
ncbi:MAG: polyribonucleotide nucleotidyltransferase, partial [Deltaproteobacteria bacterium]|nr:polyribonucleotide nucleotidyltransferase [Deltaproteobacteria bacterium]